MRLFDFLKKKREYKPNETDQFLEVSEQLWHESVNALAMQVGDRVERCPACRELYRVSHGWPCGVRIVDANP